MFPRSRRGHSWCSKFSHERTWRTNLYKRQSPEKEAEIYASHFSAKLKEQTASLPLMDTCSPPISACLIHITSSETPNRTYEYPLHIILRDANSLLFDRTSITFDRFPKKRSSNRALVSTEFRACLLKTV